MMDAKDVWKYYHGYSVKDIALECLWADILTAASRNEYKVRVSPCFITEETEKILKQKGYSIIESHDANHLRVVEVAW